MSPTPPESGSAQPPHLTVDRVESVAAEEDQDRHHPGRSQAHGEASTLKPGESHSIGESHLEDTPPALYSGTYGQVGFEQDGFDTRARIANDGRVNINIHQKSRRLSDLLVPALRSQLDLQQGSEQLKPPTEQVPPILGGVPGHAPPPPLNVVIHVVGSRGDVQPFVALGKVLREKYGHRVRLATHPTFRGFVEENDLEFFSIGGDPAELMAFMVKNPGLMPGMDSLRSGDVGKRRKGMYEIVEGCWRSCIEMGDGTGIKISDEQLESRSSLDSAIAMDGDPAARPFVADAIIANPPSFAHIHCAEKLGIPLHMMFTMPWSPTQAFPHPLANVQSSNADPSITNFVSYALVEMMTWQGLGDVINRFREKSLGLEPVSLMWAPGMASRLRIPFTYCWSPALIPKPRDWASHIAISGFYFLSLASQYTPEAKLEAFLQAGPPPVYIGFGSIVVDDPNAMTQLILDAVKKSGQRALVSKGWGGLGSESLEIPEDVFLLGNVPHDWLFKRVSCVVHHGGAGTTAAGIALGKPTVVVPFFGDQPFWGAMVAKAGAGPLPIPHKQLTADNLAAAITEALRPEALQKAEQLGMSISSENGTDVGAKDFHEKLCMDSLRCTVDPSRVAVWRVKRTNIRLSAFAATVLGEKELLDFRDLKFYRPKEYDSEDGPWDPITGVTSALMGTIGSMMMGVADFPVEILRALRLKPPDEPSIAAGTETPLSPRSSLSKLPSEMNGTAPTMQSKPSKSQFSRSTSLQSTGKEDVIQHASSRDASPALEPRRISTDSSVLLTTQRSEPAAGELSRGNSMSQALGGSLSRSSSQRRSASPHSHHRSASSDHAGHVSLDVALDTGKGLGRIVGAGLKSPMDFTLSLARGFHNAPKLYGDETVRPADRVTGFHSGLRAAGKEFGHGVFDGISGLVTQPLQGVKKEGIAGLIKGFGKGIGGVVLKPQAAFWAIPGYTFKGIYKELQKHRGSGVQNYLIAARTAQGYEELRLSTEAQRTEVVHRWQATQLALNKEKQQAKEHGHNSQHCFLRTKLENRADSKHNSKSGSQRTAKKKTHDAPKITPENRSHADLHPDDAHTELVNSDSTAFEAAIQKAVETTSRGNPEEDLLIEKAIRASVAELQQASREGDKQKAIQRAIEASVAEATSMRNNGGAAGSVPLAVDDDEQLKLALQESLSLASPTSSALSLSHPHAAFEDSGIDTDDDQSMHVAIERSKETPKEHPRTSSDEDFDKALRESQLTYEEHQRRLEKAKTEEDIVTEYIKRQSTAEEEYRNAAKRSK